MFLFIFLEIFVLIVIIIASASNNFSYYGHIARHEVCMHAHIRFKLFVSTSHAERASILSFKITLRINSIFVKTIFKNQNIFK